MKKLIIILLTPAFVLIQFLKFTIDLLDPVTSGVAETMKDLFGDMYEFWKKIFKWKDDE